MVASYAGQIYEPKRKAYPITRKFMTRSFLKVSPDMEIWEVLNLFLKHKVSGAPVVDEHGCLVGMISERDCLKLVAETTYEDQPMGGRVRDYMTSDVMTVSPDDGLTSVAQMFLKKPFKRLPVVSNGKLVGIVMRRDLLRVMQKYHRHTTAVKHRVTEMLNHH